jgi:hypothetical protein
MSPVRPARLAALRARGGLVLAARGGLILAALALGGCAYTFIPLAPDPIRLEPRLEVVEATLGREGPEIVLHARLRRIPREAYLSAYLYRGDDKVGEDSRLLAPGEATADFRFSPADVGDYRAVLFWDGRTVRQLEYSLR